MNNSLSCLLGIDIGTSSIKVLLTDTQGHRLAAHTYLYSTMQPYPGYVEQDADSTWWAGAMEGIKAVLEESGIDPRQIAGICPSGMVPNLCPLDENGIPVRPAILYRDNRAVDQVAHLNKEFNWDFNAEGIIPKLLWIKENEPDNYSRIRMILNSHSYITYKLTGVYSVDHDIASIHGAVYDPREYKWVPERMEAMGLDPAVLPPLLWSYDIAGKVTEEAAAITGLAAGTPVISGTGDSFTALLGAGAVDAGDGLMYLGTAATFLGLKDSLDEAKGDCIFTNGHGLFLGNILTGGEITHWAKDSMLKGCDVSYAFLEEAASKVSAGSDGLIALPHLLGQRTPVTDPLATGSFIGFSNAHTLGHMYRALLEGIAFSLRSSYEASGYKLSRLILMGGGCNCKLWRQIIADVLNMDLEYIPNADNALGTAYLAGMGLGLFDTYGTMKQEWLAQKEYIHPIPENVARYDTVYRFFRTIDSSMHEFYSAHKEMMDQLH